MEVDDKLSQRIKIAIGEKALSKACSYLVSDNSIAPCDDATLAELERLHPQREVCKEWTKSNVDPFRGSPPTTAKVAKTLKKFAPLSAPGPSGLRVAHLLEALHGVTLHDQQDFLNSLVGWITDCATGSLPDWSAPWIGAARVIPLKKQVVTSGLRPVAVGETCSQINFEIATAWIDGQNHGVFVTSSGWCWY